MTFDEVTLWLITAMSLTAIAFLCWTLAAVVRTSRATRFPLGSNSGRQLTGLAPHDPGSI